MGAKLEYDNEKITWRIRSTDLAYLRAVFPGNRVNAAVSDLIHLYVERMKAKARANTTLPIHLAEHYADNELEGLDLVHGDEAQPEDEVA